MRFAVAYSNDRTGTAVNELLSIAGAFLQGRILDNMKVVLKEAVANAVAANTAAGTDDIRLMLVIKPILVVLIVSDNGGGFDYTKHQLRPMPYPHELSGRGIPLMRYHADRLLYTQHRRGMRCIARWWRLGDGDD